MLQRPVAMLAVAYTAGIFSGRFVPVAVSLLCVFAACCLAASIGCLLLRRTAAGTACVLVLAGFLGALAYAPWHHTPATVRQLEGVLHTPVALEGVVRRAENLSSGAVRLTLRYDSIETPDRQYLTVGLVQITLQNPARQYCYGQRLRLGCRLRRPHNFNNPGGFDYERFLAHRNIFLTSFLPDDRGVIVLHERGGSSLLRALERYRSQVRFSINRHLSAPERDMVLALLLGEKHTLDQDIKNSFARLGAAHLLAISGLHIGIVAGLAFALAVLVLRLYHRLLLYVDLWKAAAVASILPVMLYCCIAGLQIPTLRAGIMIVICIIVLLMDRSRDIFNVLGLACLIILTWMPASLFEISFQLSFIAVFFLILYAQPARMLLAPAQPDVEQRTRTPALWLYRFLVGILSASVVATAATAPLTTLYFQQVALAGILSNAVLVPAIGFGAVPCALLAACVLPLSEGAAAGFLRMAGVILEQAILWTRFWSDMPLAAARMNPPSGWAVAAFYCLLASLPVCISRRRFALSCLLCAAVVVLYLYQPADRYSDCLRITFLDVGHGDAAVVQFPGGRTMLIDSGGLRSDRFDTGASIVAPALHALGIRRVDWLVISHPHHDHMAGMPYLLEHFHPVELWVPSYAHPDQLLEYIVHTARSQGLMIRSPVQSTLPLNIDGVVIEFLSPCAQQAVSVRTYRDVNDSSLVMKLVYGNHAFLFTGDISAQQEQALIEQGVRLEARVLKVPHHGKRGSSSEAFLDAVRPDIAVFSGRPHAGRDLSAEITERYQRRAIQMLRTDRHGAVRIISDGEYLETQTFLPRRSFASCIPTVLPAWTVSPP